MVVRPPIIACCPDCSRWLWLEDAETSEGPPSPGPATPIEPWDDPGLDAYRSVLRSGHYRNRSRPSTAKCQALRELSVRMRLWWALNSDVRVQRTNADRAPRHPSETPPELRHNLRRIVSLLTRASSIDDRLTKGEALRELGLFSASVDVFASLIEECEGEEGLDWVVSRARKLHRAALTEDAGVVELRPSGPSPSDENRDDTIPRTIDDL